MSKPKHYPRGKLAKDDEGEIQIIAGPTKDGRAFVLQFGKPTTWIGLGPEEARALGEKLLAYAEGRGLPTRFAPAPPRREPTKEETIADFIGDLATKGPQVALRNLAERAGIDPKTGLSRERSHSVTEPSIAVDDASRMDEDHDDDREG